MVKLSDIINEGTHKRFFMNFSCNSKPVEVTRTTQKVNFSEDPLLGAVREQLMNFSLIERIRESKRSPKRVIAARVREVAKYISSKSKSDIIENRRVIQKYLDDYIYGTIVKMMNDPDSDQINLIITLGMSNIIKDLSSLRELQKYLVKTKKELSTTGVITPTQQRNMARCYRKFWKEFIGAIDEKYASEENKGALSGDEKHVPINKEFSANKDSELENLILKLSDLEEYTEKDFDELFKFLDSDKTSYDEVLGDSNLADKINQYRKTHEKEDIIKYFKGIQNFSLDLRLADSVYDPELTQEDISPKALEEVKKEVNKESVDHNNREVLEKSKDLEVGLLNGSKAYVAFTNKTGYKVDLYKIPKGFDVRNFAKLVELPRTTLKVKSLDELK